RAPSDRQTNRLPPRTTPNPVQSSGLTSRHPFPSVSEGAPRGIAPAVVARLFCAVRSSASVSILLRRIGADTQLLTGKPSQSFKMPRVVPDQRSKFENEEFFRKLSRECEASLFIGYMYLIKYTGFRDRPHEERQARFHTACRDGRSEIAFVATGTNLSLQFFPANLHGEQRQAPTREYVDFDRETG
ncbi:unnamed protein product, partial [Coregonus sp. 'balchen']